MNSKRVFPYRVIGLLIGVILMLWGASLTFAEPHTQLTMSISPTSGPPGTTVTMSGSGWTGNTSGHEIHWDSKTGPILGTFSTNPNGAFTTTFKIPGNATSGKQTIWVCDRCKSIILLMPTLWTSISFEVIVPTPTRIPPTPTPTDVPTECDTLGVAGEVVITFEEMSGDVIERGMEIHPGVFYKGDVNAHVIRPDVATKSRAHALVNSEMMEFGSIDDPLRFGFAFLQDFVGAYVGLNNPRWADGPITATMTARGYPCEPDDEGHFACAPRVVGTDSVSFGPEPTPVKECLSIEAQNIFEIMIDYGTAADPEIIDNLTLRGPEEPEPLPEDDNPPIVTIELPESEVVQATNHVRLQGEVREDRELAQIRYRVNSGPFHEMGFTSAGLTPEGERLYLFGVHPLPVSEMRTCGDNLVEVVAVDAAGNEAMDLSAFPIYFGDMTITSVEAVQVVFGADLVHGKGTAFRARVNSTYSCQILAKFRLELPDDQWDASVPSSGRTTPAVPGGWEYPEIWGPVPIPANATGYTVMLPYVEPGQEDAPFSSSNPAGLVQDSHDSYGKQPDVRVVPRPIADRVSFGVEIDPQDDWSETDEGNNRLSTGGINVVKTRGWKILVIPYTTADFDCYGPVLRELESAAHSQIEYLLATYPIAEGKLSFSIMQATNREDCEEDETCGWVSEFRSGFDRGTILASFARKAEVEEFDFAVGVDCGGGGGAILGYEDAVFIGARSGLVTLAHEFNHAVVGIEDIYSLDCMVGWDEAYCEYPDDSREYCCYVDGWTHPDGSTRMHCVYDDAGEVVCEERTKECIGNCNCSIYHLEPPEEWTRACYAADDSGSYSIPSYDARDCGDVCRGLCPGGQVFNGPDGRITHPASEGFWVNRWIPAGEGNNYFMDIPAAGADPGYWMRLHPTSSHCGGYSFSDGMLAMLESPKFRSLVDPQILLVSGTIHHSGTAVLDPMYILEKGSVDLELGGTGDYYLVLRDPEGQELSRAGFSVIFRQSDPNGGPVDFVPFLHRIEWIPGTDVIELTDSAGRVLVERGVSQQSPAVKVISPNGGERWSPSKEVQIRWQAEDGDNDDLLFSLSMSPNGGETWLPLAIDLTETKFTMGARTLPEGSTYLIKVRASDGVNTAEDVSDAVFTISTEAALPASNLILVGLIIMGLLGVVALIGAVVMFIRNRAA